MTDTLLRDTAWLLHSKLIAKVKNRNVNYVTMKQYEVRYWVDDNFTQITLYKNNTLLHETMLNNKADIEEMDIVNKVINTYIMSCLEKLSTKEVEDIFDSIYGKLEV